MNIRATEKRMTTADIDVMLRAEVRQLVRSKYIKRDRDGYVADLRKREDNLLDMRLAATT